MRVRDSLSTGARRWSRVGGLFKKDSELDIDVLAAGGGAAGLSAALVLGRCHRRVLHYDWHRSPD